MLLLNVLEFKDPESQNENTQNSETQLTSKYKIWNF